MTTSPESGPHTPTSDAGVGRCALVTYATRYGSTRGVAERIATILRAGGHRVELRACDEVVDAGAYDAAVFGSAVFNQRWLPEGVEFLARNETELAARPVWLFSVGTFGDRKRLIGPLMKREPRHIGRFGRAIHPRDYRVFAGVIDRQQWPLPSRLLYHALGGHLGDNRDWHDIDDWADRIGRALDVMPPRLGTMDIAAGDAAGASDGGEEVS